MNGNNLGLPVTAALDKIAAHRLTAHPRCHVLHAPVIANAGAANHNALTLARSTPCSVADEYNSSARSAGVFDSASPAASENATIGMAGQWIAIDHCVIERHVTSRIKRISSCVEGTERYASGCGTINRKRRKSMQRSTNSIYLNRTGRKPDANGHDAKVMIGTTDASVCKSCVRGNTLSAQIKSRSTSPYAYRNGANAWIAPQCN
ncbi:hypothetical protein [Pandoraea sp. NPDC090278]|uniref:hypothetical protein n=1 Tax=Pandoraea sp. NPDC090278 TaxID=3364391 RepID=UPI00383B3049